MTSGPYDQLSIRYPLRTCSTDVNGLWRLSDVLVQMQELAGLQCQYLGCGRLDLLRDHGLVWVLTRTEIHFKRMPALGETAVVTTWAAPPRRMIYPRYFTIASEKSETLAESATQWVLCDIRDRRMADAPGIGAMIPTPDREPPFRRFTPSPTLGGGEKKTWTQVPLYTDLDVNGHVNNTRYADWLCDALGIDTMKEKRFASFSVDYRHEIRPGDEMEMTLCTEGNAFSFSGSRRGTLCFDIGGAFAPDA